MSDRVKRKIEETTALQVGRRDRPGVHDRMGLSTRGTRDPFVEAQMVEQPISTTPPGAPPGEQDVIVQPTTPPDMGGEMQPPEEPVVPEEEPGEEEPEVDVDEEMKRSLFNTLSELIDLGRIGRNEQEIRKYVEDHEDEIGELIDVLDDVVDMLIGEGAVLREPKTFDVGDEEQPPTQGGDFDETKPGVGGQVPQGGTTTTIIASDRSGGNGDALHESIMTKITAGADIDLTLERAAEAVTEETLEYGFDSPEDLNRALKVLDGMGVATTNVMKTDPTTLQVVRDDRNTADVERQLAAIRDAGITMREPVAAEGAATPATLVGGPVVGQRSTVQSEGTFTEALFSDWYVVSKDEKGVSAKNFRMDKKAAQAAVGGDPDAKIVRAGSEKDAIAKFGRRSDDVRSPEARAARGRRGLGVVKALGKAAALPWTVPVKAVKAAGAGLAALVGALRAAPAKPGEPAPAEPASTEPAPSEPAAPVPTEPAAVEPGAARMGGEHPEDAVKVTIDDPTQYASVLDQLKDHPKVSYAVGDGESVWVVSDDPGIKAALAQMASEAAATEGYQSWTRPVMQVRAAMGESEVSARFGSVEEAEAHARDLHDLGYKGIILEELNVVRTGMAVEVVFDNKQQASAAKGALLQYKGIDTVKDAENGSLVVFTTDADPEEARNRVTTILQNARVPMEGSFEVTRWKLVESNPGGQSAIGRPVPGISRAYNGPDEMPTPMPTTGGAKGSSIEGEIEEADRGWIIVWTVGGHDVASAFGDWFTKRYPDAAKSVQSGTDGGTVTAVIRPDSKYATAGAAQALADQAAQGFGRGVQRAKVASAEGGAPVDVTTTTEQAGDQDPESKRRFMQPFYAPDDEGMPPGPDVDALPAPGEPGYEEPEYDEEPGEAPEEVAVGALWRLDVPEDPMEMERLTDVLNQAKEAGVLASWTEVGAAEEELPPEVEPGAEGPPEAVSLEVTPAFAGNEPAPTAPPRIGEQADDEFGVPPEEPPAVADVEPGGAPVDELPPEEPVEEPDEEDGHYIAVEFAAETEQEERERFPDWISDTTADPETGEGGLMIAGWRADEAGEEMPGELGDEIPGEIPGETSEISPEISPESSGDFIPTRGSPTDELPVPEEERILGEDAGHLRNIYRAARVAEGRGDDGDRARFVEALVTHGHGRGITRRRMARILREDEAKLESIYPDLARRPVAKKEPDPPSDGAIELPPELARLREDHRAMVADGDEAGARRVMSELRFEAEARGVDVRDVVNEAEGKYPVAVQRMNARGVYQGKPVVVRAFYRYEDGSVTADVAVGGQTEEVPAGEVNLAPGMGEKPAWAGASAEGSI